MNTKFGKSCVVSIVLIVIGFVASPGGAAAGILESPLATPLGVDCLTCLEIAAAGYEIDCEERCPATVDEPVGNETDTSPLPTPAPTVVSPLPIPDQPVAACGIDLITDDGEACAVKVAL